MTPTQPFLGYQNQQSINSSNLAESPVKESLTESEMETISPSAIKKALPLRNNVIKEVPDLQETEEEQPNVLTNNDGEIVRKPSLTRNLSKLK